MNLTESILNYRRSLKRKNYSLHTIKNYLHRLRCFLVWISVPIESVRSEDVKGYIDYLLEKKTAPETINAHLVVIRLFYNYLKEEETIEVDNPVIKGMALRLSKPLPRHLRDPDIAVFFKAVKKPRDMAIFMLMLRCGLRVEEVANLLLLPLITGATKSLSDAVKVQKIEWCISAMMHLTLWQHTCV